MFHSIVKNVYFYKHFYKLLLNLFYGIIETVLQVFSLLLMVKFDSVPEVHKY